MCENIRPFSRYVYISQLSNYIFQKNSRMLKSLLVPISNKIYPTRHSHVPHFEKRRDIIYYIQHSRVTEAMVFRNRTIRSLWFSAKSISGRNVHECNFQIHFSARENCLKFENVTVIFPTAEFGKLRH